MKGSRYTTISAVKILKHYLHMHVSLGELYQYFSQLFPVFSRGLPCQQKRPLHTQRVDAATGRHKGPIMHPRVCRTRLVHRVYNNWEGNGYSLTVIICEEEQEISSTSVKDRVLLRSAKSTGRLLGRRRQRRVATATATMATVTTEIQPSMA